VRIEPLPGLRFLRHYVQMSEKMTWRPAPGWPDSPPGWVPPPGWQPPADWPPAPADWAFWVQEPRTPRAPVVLAELTDAGLARETRYVVFATFFTGLASAIIILATHIAANSPLVQVPTFTPHQPVLNVFLGLLSYLPVAAIVPLVLLLLVRTGQPPSSLGLTRMSLGDLGAGTGLALAALGLSFVSSLLLVPLENTKLLNSAAPLHVPAYYIIFGLSQSLITSVVEEVVVNGYLITRLDQLGWTPAAAFWTSMAVRASYHIYYGVAVVTLLPFGWLMTRSFQKHGKLSRPILAHFLYDSVLFAIAIFVHVKTHSPAH
jgi:membrane protease YdiL (CAAX protease family)